MKSTKSAQEVRSETEIYHHHDHIKNPYVTTADANKKKRFKKTLTIPCRDERALESLKGMTCIEYMIQSSTELRLWTSN